MANQKEVTVINAIIGLNGQGWSRRRIARELGIHRETVGRHLRLWREGHPSKPAISTPGSAPPKPAISTPGDPGRQSRCAPYQPQIEQDLEKGLSAQRIWQDLVEAHGFTGSYQSVKRYVGKLRRAHPKRFDRVECAPGEEAQVDFGTGAPVRTAEGKTRRPPVLRVVLSQSRKAYSEAVWRQDTESFLRGMENACRYFGGVPKTLVIDNLKAGVLRADWYDPQLNPKLESFARHYGTVILPMWTPVGKGYETGGLKTERVGRGFGMVFMGSVFVSSCGSWALRSGRFGRGAEDGRGRLRRGCCRC